MKRYFIKGDSLVGGDVNAAFLKAKGYKEVTKAEYDKAMDIYIKKLTEVKDGK